MKKILSIAAALVIAAAFISCGDSSDSFDGSTDTVITISSPKVTGKAYPGVNYITWEPVTGAASYELYRSDDGDSNKLLKVVNTLSAGAELGYADIAAAGNNTALTIADGKTYKYTVLAIGGNKAEANVNVPSRAVYLKGNQSSVSVKAIVPAAGTSVGDFAAYKDFLKKFEEKNLAKNVVITKTQYNKKTGSGWLGYYVSYPATAGLKFAVAPIEETGVDANGGYIGLDEISATTAGNYKENFTANASVAVLGSGDKDIYVKIESVADALYQPIVKKVGTIEVKGINESKVTGYVDPNTNEGVAVTAKYRTAKTDKAAATAEIYWSPAELTETGKATDTTNYIVYRKTTKDNNDDYTVVAGVEGKPAITAKKIATAGNGSTTVTVGNSTEGTATGSVSGTASKDTVATVYTFTDTIDDVSATYKYYVVHKIGDLYGAAANVATLTWSALKTDVPTIAINTTVQKTSSDKNELQILVKKANAAQTLTLKYATLTKDYKDSAITTFTDFTNTAKLENYAGDNRTYVAYVPVANYTDYVFQVEATETGKDPAYAYDQFSKLGDPIKGNPQITVNADTTDSDGLKYAVVISDSTVQGDVDNGIDSFENYIYDVYKVTTSSNRNFSNYVTVTEEKIGDKLTLSALSDANKTKYNITGNTKEQQTADSTGATKATYVGITAVTAPKPVTGEDVNKWNHNDSVRFYVVKTLKTDAKVTGSAAATSPAAFKNVNVK